MKNNNNVYDVIGIGIGPFNLGMAALADSIPGLKCLFIDQSKEFNWHPGLMLEYARLQVPFYADLVTLADPCSRFSYMAFLKAKQMLFRFAIHENNFITRREYNEYCRWVVSQLDNPVFGMRCETVEFDESGNMFFIHCRRVESNEVSVYTAKRIVIGVGMVPYVPKGLLLNPGPPLNPPRKGGDLGSVDEPIIIHSSNYLDFKEQLLSKRNLTIVGSGQSAAEIFYDLLTSPQLSDLPRPPDGGHPLERAISWFARAERFYPMEYSKLSLEMTSPDYIEYFYQLAYKKKKEILEKQNVLYKGINFSLINAIYDELYIQSLYGINKATLLTNCSINTIHRKSSDELELVFFHSEMEEQFSHTTEAVILATGYEYKVPAFLRPIHNELLLNNEGQYQAKRNYSIHPNDLIYVQNAEMHTHGFNAPDLGMGPYRNAVILNSILGYEHFVMERGVAFQRFNPLQTAP